jgi:Arc/MetJ-type ribon-helix-helix transcriptional regulator
MTTLHVNLPENVRAQAERRAAETGFSSVNDYVEALIRADAAATAEEVALLRQRMAAGPSTPMTPADFARIRARLEEQIAKRRAQ